MPEEPKRDSLDGEFGEELPKTQPSQAKGFKLAWLSNQEKYVDAAKRNKLKTLVGLALLVVFLCWLVFSSPSNSEAPKEQGSNPRSTPPTPAEMQRMSAELQNKIREQLAQLNALKKQQAAGMVDDTPQLTPEQQALLAKLNAQKEPGSPSKAPESREAEERRKLEAALHAGNLVEQSTSQSARPTQQTEAKLDPVFADALRQEMANQHKDVLQPAAYAGQFKAPDTPEQSPIESVNSKKPDPNAYAQGAYVGPLYRLSEDTVLECVLVNKLNNSFSGPVIAQVSTDAYSNNNQKLLIPVGTRVLGEVKKVEGLGDQRLALAFHRLLMPDLYPVSLDQFPGMNQQGETGLRNKVDHHYTQVFGTSIALGLLAGLSQIGNSYGYGDPAAEYRAGFTQSLSQSAVRILDRYTTILPTFIVPEGNRLKIILTSDLELPAYQNHRLPSSL